MERNHYEQTEKQSSGFRPSSRLSVEAFDLLAQFPKPVNVAIAASFSDSESLCFSSIYTGMIGADLRPQDVAHEEGEQQLEGAKALRPSEVTRREAQFTDEKKQGDWTKATEQNRLSKRQSATHECLTDEQIADLERRGLGQKFEITGMTGTGNGSAEDTGTVIDYKPQEVAKNKSFALGMDYEEGRDTRSVYQKMTDFARAAGKRAADPEGWKSYIQGELDKMIGVGEGLNIAKESTKGAVVAGWNAFTDGTVANFLAKPNAINDPLFHAVGGALTAMAEDPNAVNHALEHVGTTIMNASERYSALPNREKGHVIGETMFALIGPEGLQPLNSKTAEQMGLASMQESELAQLGIRKFNSEALELHMPEVPDHLKHLPIREIDEDLIAAIESKERTVTIAEPGTEHWTGLEVARANAKVIYPDCADIIVRKGAPRMSLLEEFLHGTQQRIGLLEKWESENIPRQIPEIHVKDFMLRHARMLGLDENDQMILQALKQRAIEELHKGGDFTWTGK